LLFGSFVLLVTVTVAATFAVFLDMHSALLCDSEHCGPTCHGCQILDPGFRVSHLVAPLQVRERIIGTLCVGSSAQRQFDAEDVDLLTRLANSKAHGPHPWPPAFHRATP